MTKASEARIHRVLDKKRATEKVVITLGDLIEPGFGNALGSLANKEPDGRTALLIARIMSERKVHLEHFNEARKILLKRFADKDEAGEPKLNESGTEFLFSDENEKREYDREWDALIKEEASISSIPESAIEKIGAIKPSEVFSLQSIIG